jgi:hypothetical protein
MCCLADVGESSPRTGISFKGPMRQSIRRISTEIRVMKILITSEGQPVFWDGKGSFSLERDDTFYMAAHFQKVLPGDDPEAFRQKAAEQLGIDVQYEEY